MQTTITISDRIVTVQAGPAAKTRDLDANAAALDSSTLVERILDAAAELDIRPARAALLIPASWCYVHRISVPQRRPSRQALAYALEEFVPLDIEQLTCEFIRTAQGEHLGVALETARAQPLLAALAENDIWVESITLAALQAISDHRPSRLLWCDEEHVALLTTKDGGLSDMAILRVAPQLADDVWCDRVLNRMAGDENCVVTGCARPNRLNALSARLERQPKQTEPTTKASAAIQFNLSRDQLAPLGLGIELIRAWRRTALAALVATLLLAVGLATHRARLEARLGEVSQWERQVFGALFPNQTQPAGVALRLASERKRLQALTMSGPSAPQTQSDALHILQAVVSALPADVRVNLSEIHIEGRDVTLRGRTRDHQQAERLTAGIDRLDSLVCGPPRTDRHRDGGVLFHIHARRSDDASKGARP